MGPAPAMAPPVVPILIPSQVELVSSELVFAPVTVPSHVPMSALVGAGPAPAFHEPAADRSVVLSALITVAACADCGLKESAAIAESAAVETRAAESGRRAENSELHGFASGQDGEPARMQWRRRREVMRSDFFGGCRSELPIIPASPPISAKGTETWSG